MRKLILPAAVIAVALLTCTVGTAEPIQLTQPNTGSNTVVVKDIVHPLAEQSITQSIEPYTIVDETSVGCSTGSGTTENAYLRLFDLDDDHGLVGSFCVESLDWATGWVVGDQDLTVTVYCMNEGLPFLLQFLTLQDSAVVPVTDEELTFHNTAVGGCCDAFTKDMVVELLSVDCNVADCFLFYIGMNDLGQTAPTYWTNPSCGAFEPLDLAGVGFPDAHLIMVVNGDGVVGDDGGADDGGADDGGGGDVPATTGVGAVLLLLILLGSGAYFLRRRAAR